MDRKNEIWSGIEKMSKRRNGFPSESQVRSGGNMNRFDEPFVEKLGRNDPCICNSGKKFKSCCMCKSSANPGDDYYRE